MGTTEDRVPKGFFNFKYFFSMPTDEKKGASSILIIKFAAF